MAGDLHLKITMMLLFANIALTLAAPGQVLGGNVFYEMDSSGQYSTDSQITGKIQGVDDGRDGLLSDFGLIDVLQLLWGIIELFIRIFGAALILAFTLPGVVSLVVGVPLVIAYGFAIVGWIK
jgi:hypothetical protein